jgi:hypothetical protein
LAVKPSTEAPVVKSVSSVSLTAPPMPLMVTVSGLSVELRRPVKVIINILERNGFKNLGNSSEVNREIALRILRRSNATPPGNPSSTQAGSGVFNSLADQLDGKFKNANGAPTVQKQNSKP